MTPPPSLEALPVGTIVHDRAGWAWRKSDKGWHGAVLAPAWPWSEAATPARLLVVKYGPITVGAQP